ncbi:PSD1 and planctomycete cytochrome C domain-containing protein [Luteolibacter algae]|uniref:PSD1 and planctomycete cytochrome C domain-containing protein n=1 Tax=Luteolibacter algae TaxID=454151 RepID=A0ABW5D8L8_9BACT
MENPNRLKILKNVLLFFGGTLLLAKGENLSQPDAERLFSLKVYPILQEKCFACHGDDPEKIKGELDLRSLEGMLKGGEYSDKVLVPGNALESDLYIAVTWEDPDMEMPPKENDRLLPEQISMLRDWINAGAPWPDEMTMKSYREEEWKVLENEDGVIVKTSGGQSDAWTYRRYKPEDIWAFQPVVKPAIPDSKENPIDYFVNRKLTDEGVEPAAEADPLTLIRRATYDLVGLPPSPGEIESFRKAWSNDKEAAWAGLIDRLLASPQYGERWAQHWLDVARYADTGGLSNDYERSNMWRYRDYVIRSINADKPYDQFIVEQIAGDEIADAALLERMENDHEKFDKARLEGAYNDAEKELIIATGFLRVGPWDSAMIPVPEARQLYLDDVVNTVGQTFLATTMRCFKCHDHKFDPLPTKDYYRMYAAFSGTQLAERNLPFSDCENTDNFEEGNKLVQSMLGFAKADLKKLVEKRENAARKWFAEHDLPYLNEDDRKDLADEVKPPRHIGLTIEEQGRLKVREQDVWIWNRRQERYLPMVQSVYNGPDVKPDARKLRIPKQVDQSWRPRNHIYGGGSYLAPGDEVGPGVLSALGLPVDGAPENDPYILPDNLSGRRLALAKWIADKHNPLTTRSIVNRVWQHHFIDPIAGNPNNFGVKGKKPTHPELLDWLAADFVENGWTFKRMHRLMMMSKLYRQSTKHPMMEKLREKDPENRLAAYRKPRRLSAEELRDSFLKVTGELNPKAGGLPIRPEISMEVALQPRMLQFSLAPAYQPDPTPRQRNRRTIYTYRVRGMADPFLEVFNQPNPNDSCEARDAAPVTPQVFTMLNSDVITDRTVAFALRLEREAQTPGERINLAFRLALGREPASIEKEQLLRYLSDMEQYHLKSQPETPVYPVKITRSLVEEFSGEPFEYEEILPSFESYQPDAKAADVSPSTRALADVCLLLLNSSEFIHLY